MTRKKLDDNPQARILAAGVYSLREVENALRDWSDGEFRPAGIKLENAINAVNEVEQAAQITLTGYRSWLMELQAAAAELHNQSRTMQTAVESKPAEPQDSIRNALRRMVDTTNRLVGDQYTTTLRGVERYLRILSGSVYRLQHPAQ